MLAALLPFFDKDMKVRAYSLFSQKENLFKNPSLQGYGRNDGAGMVNGLEIISDMGIDTLSPQCDVMVPVGNIAVFSDLENYCKDIHDRLVLLFDNSIADEDRYIERLESLKASGYNLAIRKLPVSEFENSRRLLSLMDYVILDSKKIDVLKAKIYFGHLFPGIKIVVGNVSSMEKFETLKDDASFHLFEGEFYRIPVTKGEEVAPLKVNYLELLKIVNNPDFELTSAADVIGRDTALVVELLRMVNRMSANNGITSIRHAAAMLGQRELKRWINTVVTKQLCDDKPNEITRLSLLRAKFAEELADIFDLKLKTEELFLMGLFSVLDLILDLPMEAALEKVSVSNEIKQALLWKKGPMSEVMDLIEQYENANWQEISRQMVVLNHDDTEVYNAYIKAICWYKEVFFA